MSARETTAVDASAMFPAVVVVKMPVGIIVICPPVVAIPVGAVIVTIAVVPETNEICFVGAIVDALAIVGGRFGVGRRQPAPECGALAVAN